MARYEFKLPDIGEGVTEGEIVEWHVQPGDVVAEDDPMVEVMTDKATVTIGAPVAGRIAELRFEVGQTAQVGEVLVVFETEAAAAEAQPTEPGSPAPAQKPADTKKESGPAATAVGDIREGLPGTSLLTAAGGSGAVAASAGPAATPGAAPASHRPNGNGASHRPVVVAPAAQDDYFQAKPLATPATRRLARELGVDLRRVRPSGPGGRVTKEDVRAYAARASAPAASQPAPAATPAPASAPARAPVRIEPAVSSAGEPLEERIPFVGIRRKIAERMQTAKNTAAHFTFVEECHVDRLVELRARMKPLAEAQGVKLTFLPFIVKAVVAALKKHPMLNAALDEEAGQLVLRKVYHVGIATATDAGLMVPVVRDADRRSILDVAREIERLSEGARSGSLTPQELTGSTFTITSLGKQGGLFATPVLNFPEVGILGVHQMKERPVVRDGQITIGKVMLLSLSFDHRIVDGHVGAAFAYEIIGLLEAPDRLLLEI